MKILKNIFSKEKIEDIVNEKKIETQGETIVRLCKEITHKCNLEYIEDFNINEGKNKFELSIRVLVPSDNKERGYEFATLFLNIRADDIYEASEKVRKLTKANLSEEGFAGSINFNIFSLDKGILAPKENKE